MATRLQLRKGTTTEHSTFVGAEGEVTVDTTKRTLVLHDGVTAGGKPLPTLESDKVPVAQLPDSTTSTKGVIELATQTEVNSGTDAERAVTPATLKSTFPIQTKSALNASGSAPIYACRAWVNFNGTGTVAIRANGNVSSITDNGTGDYTINFINPMSDANYAWTGSVQGDTTGYARSVFSNTADVNTTTSFNVKTGYSSAGSSALQDFPTVSVTVFR